MPWSALTKHLGSGESREFLKAAEEVPVGVGQVSMQLPEVAVPLPDHHLKGTGGWTLDPASDGGKRPPQPPARPPGMC